MWQICYTMHLKVKIRIFKLYTFINPKFIRSLNDYPFGILIYIILKKPYCISLNWKFQSLVWFQYFSKAICRFSKPSFVKCINGRSNYLSNGLFCFFLNLFFEIGGGDNLMIIIYRVLKCIYTLFSFLSLSLFFSLVSHCINKFVCHICYWEYLYEINLKILLEWGMIL